MAKIYSKEELIEKLQEIRAAGWIKNARHGNVGGVGNTVEDILEIPENNLPIANSAEWELKCHRLDSSSLITLFHSEPSPRAIKFVPNLLLPKYGWPHEEAGKKYPKTEMSFRQTINSTSRSDRGFGVVVDKNAKKVLISFDSAAVDSRHKAWLKNVKKRVGLTELSPQPYWGFDDLFHIAGAKMPNCFFLEAEVKKTNSVEYFRYKKILMLRRFALTKFIKAIETGIILVDFDARTGHNHGTKFRMREGMWPKLYKDVTII
jgi:hypothetical protein